MSQQSEAAIAGDIGRGGASQAIKEESLATTALSPLHRVSDFICSRSERVTRFLQTQASRWVEQRLCGAFVFPDPNDPTRIWGFYTLSQYVLTRDDMRRADRDQALVSSVPMALIGFMGKQDGTPRGLGAALVIDAATRAYRHADIPAWGIAVEPEGGTGNEKLWNWYREIGFIPAKTKPSLMYAPYASLIPDLKSVARAAVS